MSEDFGSALAAHVASLDSPEGLDRFLQNAHGLVQARRTYLADVKRKSQGLIQRRTRSRNARRVETLDQTMPRCETRAGAHHEGSTRFGSALRAAEANLLQEQVDAQLRSASSREETAEMQIMRKRYEQLNFEQLQQIALQKNLPKDGRSKEGLVDMLLTPDGVGAMPEKEEFVQVRIIHAESDKRNSVCEVKHRSPLRLAVKHWCKEEGLSNPREYVFAVGARQVKPEQSVGDLVLQHGLTPDGKLDVVADKAALVRVRALGKDGVTQEYEFRCHPGASLRRVAKGWVRYALEHDEPDVIFVLEDGTRADMEMSVRRALGARQLLNVEARPGAQELEEIDEEGDGFVKNSLEGEEASRESADKKQADTRAVDVLRSAPDATSLENRKQLAARGASKRWVAPPSKLVLEDSSAEEEEKEASSASPGQAVERSSSSSESEDSAPPNKRQRLELKLQDKKKEQLRRLVQRHLGEKPKARETVPRLRERLLDAMCELPSSAADSSSSSSSDSSSSDESNAEKSDVSKKSSTVTARPPREQRRLSLPIPLVPVQVEAEGREPQLFDQPYHFSLAPLVEAWCKEHRASPKEYELLDDGAKLIDPLTATPVMLGWEADARRSLLMRKKARAQER